MKNVYMIILGHIDSTAKYTNQKTKELDHVNSIWAIIGLHIGFMGASGNVNSCFSTQKIERRF